MGADAAADDDDDDGLGSDFWRTHVGVDVDPTRLLLVLLVPPAFPLSAAVKIGDEGGIAGASRSFVSSSSSITSVVGGDGSGVGAGALPLRLTTRTRTPDPNPDPDPFAIDAPLLVLLPAIVLALDLGVVGKDLF